MLSLKKGQATVVPHGFLIGQQSDTAAATGCTVILCPEGAVGSVAVRGGAPATRETDLLDPENMVQSVHAVVLSGGSAFGLDAAGGVMRYLEEQGWGVPFSNATVPIVVGASLFDLEVGSATTRPDATMGYDAAAAAAEAPVLTGNVGAGTGASVGKFLGVEHAMKGGLGAASVQSGELIVTALIAVNSLGNIFDRTTQHFVAGALGAHEGEQRIVNPLETLAQLFSPQTAQASNTTIGVVLTNAEVSKSDAKRIAGMAHDGLARSIIPVHTSFDGDALFALATGAVKAQADLVGALAALTVEHAVLNAVFDAAQAYGLSSATSLKEASSSHED